MKKSIYGGLFLTSMGVGFASCEKENQPVISNDANIVNESRTPIYDNMNEVYEKIKFVSGMGEDERRVYEQQNGSKSLLTTLYEVYEGIDMESLASQEELENYIAKYPSILSLKTNSDRELEYRPYFSDNYFSAIAGKDRLFIAGDSCYKVFDDGLVSTRKDNMESLKAMSAVSVRDVQQTDEIIVSASNVERTIDRSSCDPIENVERSTNRRDRTKLIIGCSKVSRSGTSLLFLYGKIRPYKRVLGIWYYAKRTISGKFFATAEFDHLGKKTITINENISPTLAYDVRRDSYIYYAFNYSSINNIAITSIDSWGDTPSTDKASIICN